MPAKGPSQNLKLEAPSRRHKQRCTPIRASAVSPTAVRDGCNRLPERDVPCCLCRAARRGLHAGGSRRRTAHRFGCLTCSLEDWAHFRDAMQRICIIDVVVASRAEMQAA